MYHCHTIKKLSTEKMRNSYESVGAKRRLLGRKGIDSCAKQCCHFEVLNVLALRLTSRQSRNRILEVHMIWNDDWKIGELVSCALLGSMY